MGTILIVLYMLLAVGVLLANVVFALMAAGETKEGIDALDKQYQWNPFNLVAFHPEDLTEKGRKYRKIHFACIGLFIVMMVLAILIPEIEN